MAYTRQINYVMLATLCVYLNQLIPFVQMVNITVDFFNHDHRNSCDGNAGKSSSSCKDAETTASLVAALSAMFGGILSFIFGPVLGKISDICGRKTFILLTEILSVLPSIAVLMYLVFDVSLWLYFLLNTLSLILPVQSIVSAYVADLLDDPIERSIAFSHIIGSVVLAIVIGPVIGITLTQKGCLLVACTIGIVNILFTKMCVKESLSLEKRVPLDSLTILNPFDSLKILNRNSFFRRLAVCVCINGFVYEGILNVLNFYLKAVIGITTFQLTIVVILYGSSAAIIQMAVLPYCMKRYNLFNLLVVGIFFNCVAVPLYGFVNAFWQVCIIICIGAVGSFTFPTVSALKSNSVSASEQGVVQGAVYGVRSLGQSVGPVIFSLTFKLFSSNKHGIPYVPGAPFFLGCMLSVCALYVSYSLYINRHHPHYNSTPVIKKAPLNNNNNNNNMDYNSMSKSVTSIATSGSGDDNDDDDNESETRVLIRQEGGEFITK